ncbi:MAG: hypothetical protein A3K19_30645 [Lentisphaerae bacterium RIFOXYB12_FULL_65_16]|nr:MAG: hypothetical protein A3K18_01995 [Lentisphaerae bacterium RIFOXYA12_64_32]OGV92161.1 MAG: hypothetical protein A3K19_30645 [Lentisphaerae bacterium RIFOXYB12_FULL_65_16]
MPARLQTRTERFKGILLRREFQIGQKIPSERELAIRHNVSRATIGRVISELVAEGVVERKWGKGCYYLGRRDMTVLVLLQLRLMTQAANPTSWFVYLDTLKGILAAARDGVNVNLCESTAEVLKFAGKPRHGVICLGGADMVAGLPPDMPCVLVNHHPESPYPTVVCDVRNGVLLGTRHLLESGRRRVAYIGGPLEHLSQKLRYEGYGAALAEAGQTLDSRLTVTCLYGDAEGEAAGQRLLDSGVRPDAIMCADDLRAVGVFRALTARGLRVPADVALLGFDDIPEAATFEVPLSTLHYPRVEMGERAVQILARAMNGELHEPVRDVLPMTLVLRDSG